MAGEERAECFCLHRPYLRNVLMYLFPHPAAGVLRHENGTNGGIITFYPFPIQRAICISFLPSAS